MRMMPVSTELLSTPHRAPGPSASAAHRFVNFRVAQSFFSATAAAKFGVGQWAAGSMKANSIVVVYEAMLMSDREESVQIDQQIWIAKFGAGIRIELSVEDVAADMQLDAYSVALSVHAGRTRCGYEIKLLGGATSPDLTLPPIGPYGIATYQALLTEADKTREFMGRNAARLEPQLTHVFGGEAPGAADLGEAQAVLFGVSSLAERLTEQDAANRARAHSMLVNAVRATYRSFAPRLLDTEQPSREVARAAEDWWDATAP
jgi:hypothetical protein